MSPLPELHDRWRSAVAATRDLVHFDGAEQARVLAHLGKWIVLGGAVGVLSGLAAAFFLATLDLVTAYRLDNPWLIPFLPLAGLALGAAAHYGAGRSAAGNNLIIDEIHEPTAWIPRRMAPFVYGGTIVTHLFGGSAGREGTAVQMAGSLTDLLNRLLRLDGEDRRIMLIAALAGGFGAAFGVPLAGCVFALEVQAVGRVRYDAIVPALTASIVGDLVVAGVGVEHAALAPVSAVHLEPALAAKVALAGLAFGLTGLVFAELTHGIRRLVTARLSWPPLRPFVGGVVVVGLTVVVGDQEYNGLSLGLAHAALSGAEIVPWAFGLKLLFTSVTLGSGFLGGEVTPLLVIGAALGATLGGLLGVPVPLLAAIGLVAVFGGAANTPLACTVMGAELFGADALPLFAIGCVVAYVFSSHRGIYASQRVAVPKAADTLGPHGPVVGERVHDADARRRRRRSGPATGGADG